MELIEGIRTCVEQCDLATVAHRSVTEGVMCLYMRQGTCEYKPSVFMSC